MGLRRVPFLAEVLLVLVEVPGRLVRLGRSSPRGQVWRSYPSRLETSRLWWRPGWRLRAGMPPPGNLRRFESRSHAAAGAARQ
jgi:hypothetical protein